MKGRNIIFSRHIPSSHLVGTVFAMLHRTVKSFIALQPLWVAVMYGTLIFCTGPVTQVFQVLLSTEDFEPLEEDEVPLEDPFETGTMPQRVRMREDVRCLSNVQFARHFCISSSTCRDPGSLALARVAGEMFGRNGCGAVLRC